MDSWKTKLMEMDEEDRGGENDPLNETMDIGLVKKLDNPGSPNKSKSLKKSKTFTTAFTATLTRMPTFKNAPPKETHLPGARLDSFLGFEDNSPDKDRRQSFAGPPMVRAKPPMLSKSKTAELKSPKVRNMMTRLEKLDEQRARHFSTQTSFHRKKTNTNLATIKFSNRRP